MNSTCLYHGRSHSVAFAYILNYKIETYITELLAANTDAWASFAALSSS